MLGLRLSECCRKTVVARIASGESRNTGTEGASPRSILQLVRASKARAALDGRDFVLPDDIDALLMPVLAHRVVPTRAAAGRAGTAAAEEILATIREVVPVPVPR